LKIPRRAPFH